MIFKDIILFTKIVRYDNFNHAAKQLGMSQATLSRHIARLEQALNVLLIKRDTTVFQLTDIGHKLLEKFEHQEFEMQDKLSEVLAETENRITGDLRIALPMAASLHTITPYLSAFSKKYPEIRLLISFLYADINMMKENFDVAIVFSMPLIQNQKVRLLRKTHNIMYCHKSYIGRYGLLNDFADLHKHNIIGLVDNHYAQEDAAVAVNLKTKQKTHIAGTGRMIINSSIHAQEIARSGEAICFGMDIQIEHAAWKREFVHLFPEYAFGLSNNLYLLIPPEGLSLKAKVFVDFAESCLQNTSDNPPDFK